jgi:DNA-binding beta-propeller fold protein YncE
LLTSWLLTAAAILTVAGCNPPATEDDGIHPVWPLPPAQPRVRHVKNIRGQQDIARPNPFEQFGRLITGHTDATLLRPHAAAVVEGKTLYVTDQERQAVAVFDLKTGKARWITQADDTYLVSPVGVAAVNDDLAVSDSALKRVFVFSPKGKLEAALAKPGGWGRPTGLAFDAERQLLYVADTVANEICVFKVPGYKMVRKIGAHGIGPAEFNCPTHLCLDREGRLYVTDSLNFRVQVLDGDGRYLAEIGKLGDASGHLAVPKGVGVDSYGHIYVVDSYFSAIQAFDRKGRFLLTIGSPGAGSGQFQVPSGLLVDSQDRIYICDSLNRRIQLLEYIGGPTDETPSEAATNPATAPAGE